MSRYLRRLITLLTILWVFQSDARPLRAQCDREPVSFAFFPESFEVAETPRAIVTADLNGDGLDDVITGNQGPTRESTLTILVSHGDGSFEEATHSAAADSLSELTRADFDADGDVDLASIHSDEILLFSNQGDGSLGKPISLAVERSTRFLVAADVSGDGAPDLITVNPAGAFVQVLLNAGGTFSAPATFAVGERPVAAAPGDVDADGDVDLAVANRDAQSVTILENLGAGDYVPAPDVLTANRPTLILAADVTDDGADELVVGDTDGVALWKNDGAGRFTLSESFDERAVFLEAADYAGDGALQIAAGNIDGHRLHLLAGAGSGAFTVLSVPTPQTMLGATGDFNGDDAADLALTAAEPSRVLTLLRDWPGTVHASFRHGLHQFGPACQQNPCEGINPHDIQAGDVNLDGRTDVLVANGHLDSMTVLLGAADGTFKRDGDYHVSFGHANSIDLGDFDLDGDLDTVMADFEGSAVLQNGQLAESAQIAVLLNAGDGTYGAAVYYPTGRSAWMVRTADLDQNGALDLMVANVASADVTLYFNPGDANFTGRLDLPVGADPWAVAAGDLDGDGDVEIVTANRGSGALSVLSGAGMGTFSETTVLPVPLEPVHVLAIDTDNDGHLDLITSHGQNTILATSLGRGDGTFAASLTQILGQFPWSATPADIDGDGVLDLAIAGEGTDSLSLVLGLGNGRFSFPYRFQTNGGRPRFLAAGDFDGDSDIDFVSANRFTSTISLLVNETPSAAAGDLDFLTTVCTPRDFRAITAPSSRRLVRRAGRYIVPARPDAALGRTLFQNVNRFPSSQDFLRGAFPEHFANLTPQEYTTLAARRAARHYYVGAIGEIITDAERVYGFEILVDSSDPAELLTLEETRTVYEALTGSFQLEPLVYSPDTPQAREVAAGWVAPGFEIFLAPAEDGEPGEPPGDPAPVFELEIPAGLEICGSFFVAGGGRDVRREHALKSRIRLRTGAIALPSADDTFTAQLFEEVRFGPRQALAEPLAPGTFRVLKLAEGDGTTLYRFTYAQAFALPSGSLLEVLLVTPQQWRDRGAEALDGPLHWDEDFFTRQPGTEAIQARLDGEPLVRYGSCTGEVLPLVTIRTELEDGTRILLEERFEEAASLLETAPAHLVRARIVIGKTERVVTDYFRLVYSAFRHNVSPTYWVLFDTPVTSARGSQIHGVQLATERTPDVPAHAAYLDAKLEVLQTVALAGAISRSDRDGTQTTPFRRGDVTADGSVNVADAIDVLGFLFRGDAAPACRKAADSNDDGQLNILDPIATIAVLFGLEAALPEPFAACGIDRSEDALTCVGFGPCF